MHLLAHVYSVLAFAEILMLFASIIGVLVFAVRRTIEGIDRLIDAAIDLNTRDKEPRVRGRSCLNVAVESGFHRIPGGHNERF